MKSEAFFDLPQKKSEIEEINKQLTSPETWKDQEKSQFLQRRKKTLEREIELISRITERKEELEVLIELAEEGDNVIEEIKRNIAVFDDDLEEIKLQTLFDE